jgi:hypothetical protein
MSDGISPITPAEQAIQEAKSAREGYVTRDLVAIDEAANVITGGLPDETISSRSARAAERGSKFGILMSKFLDLFEKDHGALAQAGDVERAQAVEQIEKDSPGLEK